MYRCFICQSVLTGMQRKYCGPQCVKKGHLIRANIWSMENAERRKTQNRIGIGALKSRLQFLEDRVDKLAEEVDYLLDRLKPVEIECIDVKARSHIS